MTAKQKGRPNRAAFQSNRFESFYFDETAGVAALIVAFSGTVTIGLILSFV